MSGDGIVEVDDCLEEDGDNVLVDVEGLDDIVTIHNCTLSRFREEWVRAKKY